MRSAPEMVPSLDDALNALDGFPGRVPDIGLAVRFLEQLNGVRDVAAVIPDQHQAAVLEGAYQAGFRCADESGHVLVVSLPDLLAYAVPAPRPSWRDRLRRWFGPGVDCSCGRYQHVEAEQHEPECAAYAGAREDVAIWKKRALEAENTLREEARRLDFIEAATRKSPTGVSFDKYGGAGRVRFMRRGHLGEPTFSVRAAIDDELRRLDAAVREAREFLPFGVGENNIGEKQNG